MSKPNPYHAYQEQPDRILALSGKTSFWKKVFHRLFLHCAGLAALLLAGVSVYAAKLYFTGASNPSSYQSLAAVFMITVFSMPFLILFSWYLQKQEANFFFTEKVIIRIEFLAIPFVFAIVVAMCLIGYERT